MSGKDIQEVYNTDREFQKAMGKRMRAVIGGATLYREGMFFWATAWRVFDPEAPHYRIDQGMRNHIPHSARRFESLEAFRNALGDLRQWRIHK